MTQRRLHPVSRFLALFLSLALSTTATWAQSTPDTMGKISTDELGRGAVSGGYGQVSVDLTHPSTRQISANDPGLGIPPPNGQLGNGWPQRAGDPDTQKERPLPPNEFQKFVLTSTGQSLPLYGYNLFKQLDPAYNAPANVPVSPDYTLGPGDELQIRGWGSMDMDVKAVVNRDGSIYLPNIGAVSLAGVRHAQAESVIRKTISRYYRDVQLSVTLGRLRGITVYVVGQARKPGAYALSSVSTLITGLFASGGPNATGSMRHILLKRDGHQIADLDLYAFIARGEKSSDIRLQDGDTIVVPPAYGYVAITGVVSNPAVYEIAAGGETIGSMLSVGGGLPVVADAKKVFLERTNSSAKSSRSAEVFALDAAGLVRKLASGDILTIAPIRGDFGNVVSLRGNVDLPVRMPFKDGMKITDLIPDRSTLMSRASIKRQNEVLMTDEARQRASADFVQADGDDRRRGNVKQDPSRDTADTLSQRIGNLVDEVNFDYAVVERVDAQKMTVSLIPFNLGKALSNPASAENLSLRSGDVVTIFSVNDVQVPKASRAVFVRVEGEVRNPGVYQVQYGEAVPQLISKAGGLTPDAYLFGSAFYREEVRLAQEQNLERLVRTLEARASSLKVDKQSQSADKTMQMEAAFQQRAMDRLKQLKPTGRVIFNLPPDAVAIDSLPALRLENKDRLVIPAKPSFVYVLGSVNAESALIWQPGESASYYLDRAGVTGGADMTEAFILRMDGSVYSTRSGWFSSIGNAKVLPGDFIVLPEKVDHETAWSAFMTGAKDITQIVYQFSLGAAALKTLRN